MKEITSIPAFESVPTSSVSNIEFVEIVDELRPDQWADWDVVFSYNGKEYIKNIVGHDLKVFKLILLF